MENRPTSSLRRLKRAAFRALLRVLPLGFRVTLTKRVFPQLRRYLPYGREITIDDYLGELRVVLDMTYPVEREMLVNWYEPDAIAVIDALVGAGDVCLDIGANVGALTLAMARRVGPTGKVYAFEPGPLTYPRLARNVELNPSIRGRVALLQLGVADKPGTLYWNEEPDNRGNATLLRASGAPVQIVSIDGFFVDKPLGELRFVKIDVEGMEYEVLRGGRSTWLTHRPLIYFETLRDFESARGLPLFEGIEAFLRGMGYGIFRVDEDRRLRVVTAATVEMYTLAVPATHSELVDGARLPGAAPRPRRPTPTLVGPRSPVSEPPTEMTALASRSRRLRRRANRRFYRLLFRAYRALFPTPRWMGSIPAGSLRRVLVVQRSGVGDMILTTPVLTLLKDRAPGAEIDVLASHRNAEVVVGDACVARVLIDGESPLGRLNVIRQLRARRYDAVFSGQAGKHMREGLTASLVARRHTYKVSIWRPKRYQGLFTTVARVPPSATHTAEQLLSVGHHALGIRGPVSGAITGRYAPRMAADERTDAQAAAFLSAHGVNRYLLVNVAAHFAVRDWPPAHCATFIALLLERHGGLGVVVTRPPGKESLAAEVVRRCQSPRVVLAPALPVLGVAALVRRAVAVVTPDTALVHIASACRRPVVALYAPAVPSDVTLWLPIGVPCRALASRLGGGVGEIAPERVLEAFDALLRESADSPVAAR